MHPTVSLVALLAAVPTTEPSIELVTMGQGPMLFHRYGHAALCVVHRDQPRRNRCYNYGTTDFGSPPQELGWRFLRGTAKFWVSIQGYAQMRRVYRRYDRSIWVQRLPLTQAQVTRLVRRLEHDAREENRYYVYHHFDDNCTTRLRDHIDQVTGGALRRDSRRSIGITFRELGRRGIADQTGLILISHFILGRRLDREVSQWESMFHPDYLRAEVTQRLGAAPVQVYRRRAPPLPQEGSWGYGWIVLAAVLLALPLAITTVLGRYSRAAGARWLRWALRGALGLVAVPLTLLALGIWLVALVSCVPELQVNEALLVFWPTDLGLVILGAPRRVWYARIRLAGVALVALLSALGVLVQPLWALLLLPALPCLALLRWDRRLHHALDDPPPQPV